MSSVNQRLNSVVIEKKITQVDLASKLEIDYKQFNGWCLNVKPSINGLEKVLRYYPDINARWLLTGEGSMFYDNVQTNEIEVNRTTSGCSDCLSKDKELKIQEKLIQLLEEKVEKLEDKIMELKALPTEKTKENIGQKNNESGTDKAAEGATEKNKVPWGKGIIFNHNYFG